MSPETQKAAESIGNAWRSILTGPADKVSATTTILKYMNENVQWIMSGDKVYTLQDLVGFACDMRANYENVSLTVTHFTKDEDWISNRHISESVRLKDGVRVKNETMQFLTLDKDGKIDKVLELSKDIEN
jgi:hypothetical protein